MAKKIFIVTAGTYSDYSIYGVFSTKALANKYIRNKSKHDNWWDTPEIEEWILDEQASFVWRTAYCEEVDLRGFEPKFRAWARQEFAIPNTRSKIDYTRHDPTKPQGFIRFISYVSAKHAHDLCVKELQRISAENLLLRGEI